MPIHDRWVLPSDCGDLPDLPVPAPLVPIYARRGVRDAASFAAFTAPAIEGLHDPATIGGMDAACERIFRAIRDREPILIYGDYDVDGVTSIVLLRTVLRALGAAVDFVVPHRLFDGYGLRTEVLARVLAEKAVRLVITVDCGITSVEPVADALERGIDVIITDHHLPPELVPGASAVLNPKQEGCTYPYKELAGVGVTFKLCCELLRRTGSSISVGSLLKIAAIGTVADVAPLTGENRAIVRIGLDGLADPRNPGLRALLRSLGLLGRPLRASDVGFRIGPRINAAGRLASATTAIDLFDSRSEAEAGPLVERLHQLNRERQSVEREVLTAARAEIERLDPLPPILVIWGEGWHKGVLGLCAGRLAQIWNRPALVISREGEEAVGSGRSIRSIDLHAELETCRDLFTRFGGHTFACGFSLPASNLQLLRDGLVQRVGAKETAVFTRAIAIDAAVSLEAIDEEFQSAHALLEPFGQDNAQPVLLLEGVSVEGVREFSPGCLRLILRKDSRRMPAVCWPSTTAISGLLQEGRPVDVLARLEPDRFDGVRLEIADAARGGDAPIESISTASRSESHHPTWFAASKS